LEGLASLQLYSYNGQSITYDAIGNPLTYINGRTFTWQNGRNLATVNQGSKSISYAYNADGLRTSKTVNGVTTEYYWFEGRLLGQKTGNDTILFLYDENGRAYGFVYNGSPYYYFFNAQGDVAYIMGTDGGWYASYTYDEWGNLLSATGDTTLANLNPIRYRGYYYDAETGLYYVSSRYYDPEIGRWINADSFVSTETGESRHPDLDHPEPIGPHRDYRDPSGTWWRIGPGNSPTLKYPWE